MVQGVWFEHSSKLVKEVSVCNMPVGKRVCRRACEPLWISDVGFRRPGVTKPGSSQHSLHSGIQSLGLLWLSDSTWGVPRGRRQLSHSGRRRLMPRMKMSDLSMHPR